MSSENRNAIRAQIASLRQQLTELQKNAAPEHVSDYSFATTNGNIKLSELFGDKDALFVIHNMGISCPYCTLWADGFNGVAQHLCNRASVVISSPDSPEVQQNFRTSRHWKFTMVSVAENSFAADMGYHNDSGYQPGVSVFKRAGKDIVRVSDTPFGPGDDFCATWHLLDMLPEGADGWQPQHQYT